MVAHIRAGLRPYDIITRYGGDEFICSMPGQSLEGARERFDRIARQIAADQVHSGISVGLAEAEPGLTLDALIAAADQAMIATRRR